LIYFREDVKVKRQEKGLLLERNGGGVILTAEGEFCRISPPTGEIGEEISFSRSTVRKWWMLALAAAVLAMFVGLGAYEYTYARPVAYVALDINPSLELGIDRKERVVEISLLTEDAEQLVAGLSLKGTPVTEAIRILIVRAEELAYLSVESPALVLITVVPARRGDPVPETGRLVQAAVEQFKKKRLPAEIVAAAVPAALRQEARKAGLSVGRYAAKTGVETRRWAVGIGRTEHEDRQEGEAGEAEPFGPPWGAGPPVKALPEPAKGRVQDKGPGGQGEEEG